MEHKDISELDLNSLNFNEYFKIKYEKVEAAELKNNFKMSDGKLLKFFGTDDYIIKGKNGECFLIKKIAFEKEYVPIIVADEIPIEKSTSIIKRIDEKTAQ